MSKICLDLDYIFAHCVGFLCLVNISVKLIHTAALHHTLYHNIF